MKQLTCEMCGSTDLLKQEGVFVCQSCGCKYTVEEAKKLLVEVTGKVDVSGSTVKIDKEEEIKNLLIIARRSYENSQYKVAAQQYNDVLKLDPYNAEAAFFSVLSDSIDCKVGEITHSANVITNSMDNCTKLINQIKSIKDKETLVSKMVVSTIFADKTFTSSANNYMNSCGRTMTAMGESLKMMAASGKMITKLAECIIKNIDYSKNIYNSVIKCYEYKLSVVEKKYKPKYEEKISELRKTISSNENKIAQKKEENFEKKPEEEKKKIKYNKAKKLMNKNDIDSIEEALEIFREITPWEDADLKIQRCEQKIDEIKSKKYTEYKEKYEKFCSYYNDYFDVSLSWEEKSKIHANIGIDIDSGNIVRICDINTLPLEELISNLNYKNSEQMANDIKDKIESWSLLNKKMDNDLKNRSKAIIIIWVVISFVVGIIVWFLRSKFGYSFGWNAAPPQWLAYGGIPTLLLLIPVVLFLIKKQGKNIVTNTIKKYQNENNNKMS